MIGDQRVTLDTNILIYAVDLDSGSKHRTALDLLGMMARLEGVLTLQALGEFYYATTRKRLLSRTDAKAFVNDWRAVYTVVAASEADLMTAIEMVAQHSLSFWDALLCATARQAGCGYIISENMHHGHRVGGVEIIDPFSDEGRATIAELMA